MPEFIEVASLDKIPPGSATTVFVGDKAIALYNLDGTVFATNDGCLHVGASLGTMGRLDGKVVTCQLHGWKFNVTTGEMPNAPGMKLRCYPVRIVGDKVQIAV